MAGEELCLARKVLRPPPPMRVTREIATLRVLFWRLPRAPQFVPHPLGLVVVEADPALPCVTHHHARRVRALEERVAPIEEHGADRNDGGHQRMRSWSGSKVIFHSRRGPAMTLR